MPPTTRSLTAGDPSPRGLLYVFRRACHSCGQPAAFRPPPPEIDRRVRHALRPSCRRRTLNPDTSSRLPDRNLALELVRVTEAAALAAAPLVGMGEKEAADQAAVDGMRYMLQSIKMDGIVVIGEGEKDEAPMLYNGEQIGDGSPPQVDIAVDPLEGTTLAAHGMPSALAVIALSSRGTMFDPGPCVYMEKMAGSPEIADLLDLDRPLGDTVRLIAERKDCAMATSWRWCSTALATRRGSRRSAPPARGCV